MTAGRLLERPGGAAVDSRLLRQARNRQIADLSGAAVGTGPQRAVAHHSQADAAVQPQQDVVRPTPCGAPQTLGHGCQVDVVAVAHRNPEVGRQGVAQARLLPAAQMTGVAEGTRPRVDHAGRRDDDLVDPVAVQSGGGEHRVDRRPDLVPGVDPAALRDGHRVRGDDVPGQGGHRSRTGVLLHVDSDDVTRRGVDAVGACLRAGAAGHDAGLLDELPGRQPVHQGGDRGLGQAGYLADLAAGQRAVIEQQAERDLVVDLPQQSW